MSDTLHNATAKILKRLAEHEERYKSDPEYRKWWGNLDNSGPSKLAKMAGAIGH